jgi:hypothetical protein
VSAPTLSEALAALSLAHTPAGHYRHDVVDAAGLVLFTGTASAVWAWLKAGRP